MQFNVSFRKKLCKPKKSDKYLGRFKSIRRESLHTIDNFDSRAKKLTFRAIFNPSAEPFKWLLALADALDKINNVAFT